MEDTDTGLFRVTVRRADGRFRNEHATTVRAGSWRHALAQAAGLPTGSKWVYEKIAEGEEMSKSLDLKITVISSDDPDKVLGTLAGSAFMLKASPSGRCLSVIRIERADGQPLGLEGAFEKYWNAHASETPTVKEAVRDAYLAAAKKFGAS